MSKKEFEFYSRGEIKNLLLGNERLVYADNGIDEVVVRYSDLPNFIVDMSRNMGHQCNLKVYKYPSETMTPILTTIGEFLDKCDKDVRTDIIERLIQVQTKEDTKSYKIIDEYDLEEVQKDIKRNVKVKILNIWKSDFDDVRCNAVISINGKDKANIIASFDCNEVPDWNKSQEVVKKLIAEEWEQYFNLPKISKCSKLLQEIYDTVCESDSTMCHIDYDDWKEHYADRYNEKDLENLKEEVKKYKLDNVITFDDEEYKIIGWGNLENSFNDDRNLVKNKDLER